MDNQIQSLSNQIYNIKRKITDLEYYNLMETLSVIAKGGRPVGGALEYVLPPLTTSSASSPPPSSNKSSLDSVCSCCCKEHHICLC
tara:strand:+ start:322 stop:579 length:258 start_codon:yes stop_codon:yes gene_type:complete